jgi:N-carbamoylputrescine amidase
MKINYVQWPALLAPDSPAFAEIANQVRESRPDVLVTNEMPFGDWVWSVPSFDRDVAAHSVALHGDDTGLAALRSLGVPIVISSRPVWAGERVSNEAFALVDGAYVTLHHKHYFPEEPGWHEASWFLTKAPGFEVHDLAGLRVGVLLCTEAMFNERARAYGRQGADLIVVPRAGGAAAPRWAAACAMAAVVSGAYVVSSNRVGSSLRGDADFGGEGLAFGPDGTALGITSAAAPMGTLRLDLALSAAQKTAYPCYVSEGFRFT